MKKMKKGALRKYEKKYDKKAIKSNGKLSITELRKQLIKAKKDGNTKLVKRIIFVLNDVLKIDCECCECMLTQNMIEKYKEWYIAIHKFAFCYYAIKKYLNSVGKLVYVTSDKKERMYARSYYE